MRRRTAMDALDQDVDDHDVRDAPREVRDAAIASLYTEELQLAVDVLCAPMPELYGDITFFVPGTAKPKGTLISGTRKDGRRFQRQLDNGHSDWAARVTYGARGAMGNRPPLEGPIHLELTFPRARPKNQFGTGKKATVLRADAPALPACKPDADKLMRLVADALTGVVYVDDQQITTVTIRKRWGDVPGVQVLVRQDVAS